MPEKDFFSALKEQIEEGLNEEADKIIENFVEKFRCELMKNKSLLIARMIDGIEWLANFDNTNQQMNFQINIKAGADNGNTEKDC